METVFCSLTEKIGGGAIAVNVGQVRAISRQGASCVIHFDNQHSVLVEEAFETALDRMRDAGKTSSKIGRPPASFGHF